jgi:solute carrier family 13 (sodium-dependent dicarboxylate transporter), member 2/3/5
MDSNGSLRSSLVTSLLIIAGPLAGWIAFLLFGNFSPTAPMSAKACLFVTVWMAVWWMTEAVPLEATAMLPIVLMPLLGIQKIAATTAEYADPNVFLYLGGIGIAFGIEKTGLHRRGALMVLTVVGTSPAGIVGGFMFATAALSMWISNTATTILMLPLARSVILISRDPNQPERVGSNLLACSLLLGIAYAASLGGLGTLVGTPTNVFFRGFMEELGQPISFFSWMATALPLVVVLLFATWGLLSFVFYRQASSFNLSREWVREEQLSLPPWSPAQFWVLAVFLCAALCWSLRELLIAQDFFAEAFPWARNVHDSMIAMAGMLLLLIVPVPHPRSSESIEPYVREWRRVLDWDDLQKAPWGILLLLGGGLSLAKAIQTSGLSAEIASAAVYLKEIPVSLLVLVIISAVVFLSELASNVATATTVLPILAGVAQGLGIEPQVLLLPAILAASCGFMLPVATPPNAIVFGERQMTMRQMMSAGIVLDLICIAVIWLFALTLIGK